jgi:uncharacterized protein YecE (DUF72 family)
MKAKPRKDQILRSEKREKQRKLNIVRAEKMHQLRTSDKLDDEIKNLQSSLLPLNIKSEDSKINIGCSGWFYWDWKGLFYPEELPMNKWFDHYSSTFKTVELNAPFYSWPTLSTIKNWVKNALGKEFVYTVKVCELITHIKRFEDSKEMIKDFGIIADLLGPVMGCFLYQMPPSFSYSKERLKLILKQLEPTRRNVVEFRHKSWWNDEVYEAFKKHNVIFCSVSAPKLPEELIKTADEIYIRFHGTSKWYRHDYGLDELKKWAEWINKSKAKKIWIYFNNDREGYSIKNSKELLKLLSSK